jgi:hypothetical protein
MFASPLKRIIRAVVLIVPMVVTTAAADPLGNYIILVNNDLGMHCMNLDHSQFSVLPPYNDLQAQIIHRGDVATNPQIVTGGLTLEYSFAGNTYSAGKTNFWNYVYDLFGVSLPPDVGLTGKTLDDIFDLDGDIFRANGIPITPFMDMAPNVEQPYQVANVVLRASGGTVLARAYPVVPVSIEMNCVSFGCHPSMDDILSRHAGPSEGGFSMADQPILCAQCHGSTPLTGPNPGSHGWFSLRMHEKHEFIDQQTPGIDGCYKCHPGPVTQCLRGTMATNGVVCQDCHGTMAVMKSSIEEGRVPWVDEPACRTCHTEKYGEPVGQLYRNSRGHGGVLCSNCHNSPHADFPSREQRDNQVVIDLQGYPGILTDCTVCHGIVPTGPGPHGTERTTAVRDDVPSGGDRLRVFPSPAQPGVGCTIIANSNRISSGKLLVFDVRGRTVRMLHAKAGDSKMAVIAWDGRDGSGAPVASGTYFLRWDDGQKRMAGKVVLLR